MHRTRPVATQAAIDAAYKDLAFKYHPDRTPSPIANAIITRINGAYAVLRDPKRRWEYDEERAGRHVAEKDPSYAWRLLQMLLDVLSMKIHGKLNWEGPILDEAVRLMAPVGEDLSEGGPNHVHEIEITSVPTHAEMRYFIGAMLLVSLELADRVKAQAESETLARVEKGLLSASRR